MSDLRLSSVAPATRKLREQQWRCYEQFCEDHSLPLFPCTPDRIALYIAFLSPIMKPSSIESYLQGIVFKHVTSGRVAPKLADPRVKTTLSGVKNKYGTKPDQKDPLFLDHLASMRPHLDWSDQPMVLTWLASILMFRCLLRVGQVVSSPHILKRDSVTFTSYGLLLKVNSSKTRSRQDPPALIPVNRMTDKSICIVHLLEKMFNRYYIAPSEPLFSSPKCPCLTYSVFSSNLKSLLSLAGIKGNYSSHSLRHGGATSMSQSGFSVQDIKRRGGWRSSCVNQYIKHSISHAVTKDSKWVKKLS